MPSSVIAAFYYNSGLEALRIVFVSGMVYEYRNVPERIYEKFKRTRSKGSFLNRHIKGRYDFKKITQ